MIEKLKNYFKFIVDLIYVKKCLNCYSNSEDLICKKCYKEISFLSNSPMQIYNSIPVYCATLYEKVTKKLIRKLKFNHKKQTSIVLSQILFEYFKRLDLNKNFIIIYPPTFFSREFKRGYNHMNLISKQFAKLTNFKIEKKLIKKVKYTKPQYQAKDRFKNIKDSFEINKNLINIYKDKSILIIDDILTSGATMQELINCLTKTGFSNITCIAISKAGK